MKFKSLKKPYGKWCSTKCQLKDRDFIEWRNNVIDFDTMTKNIKKTLLEKYGDENYNNREKAQKTMLERYGTTNCLVSECPVRQKWEKENLEKYGKKTLVNTEKIKQTKLERYGDEYYVNFEKGKKTMMERYGGEYTLTSNLAQKVRQTKLERYGDEYYTNTEKAKKTMMERYGIENPYQLENVRKKINYDKIVDTKRRIGALNSSNGEHKLLEILKKIFNETDIITEYQDERYKNPKNNRRYCCDFYIKSIDLFIELQGHYTHGKHPYDSNSREDILLKEKYESKVSNKKPSYQKIIDIWCNADVVKRNVAKENNLNYLEIFSLDFTEESIRKLITDFIKNKSL